MQFDGEWTCILHYIFKSLKTPWLKLISFWRSSTHYIHLYIIYCKSLVRSKHHTAAAVPHIWLIFVLHRKNIELFFTHFSHYTLSVFLYYNTSYISIYIQNSFSLRLRLNSSPARTYTYCFIEYYYYLTQTNKRKIKSKHIMLKKYTLCFCRSQMVAERYFNKSASNR